MQNNLSNTDNSQVNGEVIGFYGDMIAFSEDAKHYATVTDGDELISFVTEHKDQNELMIMYPAIAQNDMPQIQDKILQINPHTDFKQIDSMAEFVDYINTGSHEIDRELHPVQEIEMINTQVLYDVLEREVPEVKEPTAIVEPRVYIKASDIGNELGDLNKEMRRIGDMNPQEFIDYSGLKGYDGDRDNLAIKAIQIQLSREYTQQYVLPSSLGKTIDNISNVIPGSQAKNIGDAIEFAHDLVGDKGYGDLKIELDTSKYGECHIKGVYRSNEDENTKENTQETNEKSKEGFEMKDLSNEKDVVEVSKENEQTNTQPFDSTAKAQEILETANLNDFSQANENDYVMEMD